MERARGPGGCWAISQAANAPTLNSQEIVLQAYIVWVTYAKNEVRFGTFFDVYVISELFPPSRRVSPYVITPNHALRVGTKSSLSVLTIYSLNWKFVYCR